MPYHRLDVFKKSYQLALELHHLTLKFPSHEKYELGQQLRRSSKSIPVNIAEGMGKQESQADVRRFVRIAIGSCDESRVWLEFARDLDYIPKSKQQEYDLRYREVGRMLQGLLSRYGKSSI
jgi:four helix bundle protein